MLIFAIITVLSFVLWIYYKVAILNTNDGLKQAYFHAKSRICLGSFLVAFTINQYIFYQTRISLFVGIVFLVFAIPLLNRGIKEVKHYKNEWKRLNIS
ncbi:MULTISPECIES: YtpI family protein [Virgibacillus]|uniref:Membrane protein n=1 Tax=Virgibacillus pantothenticus TaxID=1473 RepID=A0A0L0QRE8_VIRPA|nr:MULTISPECIES: YtpI family protein [Virgibacillus]API90836.1 hypothetical protein BKP57_02590 [Virgibacillus sp. 6R]KNE20783.1 membrane protein [Virgibacillus pantothenticus]MBS7426729.1 YtpI family protein [Virgibacillus sp. 19R1-5]MBU8566057.1 YtpI family protein [Virgibacillus pantothenticus]MBU8602770.1 YtpI family protein [Virgibacillus pantothenticus]